MWVIALGLALSGCGDGAGAGPDALDEVDAVAVSPASVTVPVGGTAQLEAAVTSRRGEVMQATVSWTSVAPSIAGISASGLVTGVSEGRTTAQAEVGGRRGSSLVTVVDASPPTSPGSVTASPASNSAMDIAWTDRSSTETEFRIEREEASSPGEATGTASAAFVLAGTVGADQAAFRDTGLQAGSWYRYRVSACHDFACSEPVHSDDVRVWETLEIVTATLPDGTTQADYREDLEATGGDEKSYVWELAGGRLPEGLDLLASGRIEGTPTEPGTFDVQLRLVSGGQEETATLQLTVRSQIRVIRFGAQVGRFFYGEQLLDFVFAQGIEMTLEVEAERRDGRPLPESAFQWTSSLDGPLGTGPEVNTSALSVGDHQITVVITDADGATAAYQNHYRVIPVREESPDCSQELPTPEVELWDVTTENGYTWYHTGITNADEFAPFIRGIPNPDPGPGCHIRGGSLYFHSDNGYAIEWCNITHWDYFRVRRWSVPARGSQPRSFTITVRDEACDVTRRSDVVAVDPPDNPVRTQPSSLWEPVVGQPFETVLPVEGGNGTYTWKIVTGVLPTGLELEPSSGRIHGVPLVPGRSWLILQVTSAGQPSHVGVALKVRAAG